MSSDSIWQAGPVKKPGLGTILAAIILPPLALFLTRGLGPVFWIGVLLTLIGWLPGVVFALVAMFRPDVLGRLAK